MPALRPRRRAHRVGRRDARVEGLEARVGHARIGTLAAERKLSAEPRAISKRVSPGSTWILPMSSRVTPPRRQRSGRTHFGFGLAVARHRRAGTRPRRAAPRARRALARRWPRRRLARGAGGLGQLLRRRAAAPAPGAPARPRPRADRARRAGARAASRSSSAASAESAATSAASRSASSARISSALGTGAHSAVTLALAQHPLEPEPLGGRGEQHRQALPPRAAGAAAPVLQRLGVAGQVGVEHELDAGQVEAARRDVGRHEHAGAPVAERLERPRPLRLRELAGDAPPPRSRARRASRRCAAPRRASRGRRARLPARGARSTFTMACSRSRGATTWARYAMSAWASSGGVAATRTASRVYFRASSTIGLGSVAEKSTVRRPGGVASRIASSSSRKPMSSISSASSRTTARERREVERAAAAGD